MGFSISDDCVGGGYINLYLLTVTLSGIFCGEFFVADVSSARFWSNPYNRNLRHSVHA